MKLPEWDVYVQNLETGQVFESKGTLTSATEVDPQSATTAEPVAKAGRVTKTTDANAASEVTPAQSVSTVNATPEAKATPATTTSDEVQATPAAKTVETNYQQLNLFQLVLILPILLFHLAYVQNYANVNEL